MSKFIDKLWNWGHLEGSHNWTVKQELKMSPEAFAEKYGIKNSFIVSYMGNINPPFSSLARRFSCLNQVKWSVLGDASTPLPESELGNTDDIIEALKEGSNITGGVVDDFFSPDRLERFTPEVLKKIKAKLNTHNLDFSCVLYQSQLDLDLDKYIDCFDIVTFWIWGCEYVKNVKEYLDKLFKITKDKPVMLGIYLWDYPNEKEMDRELFKMQISLYFDLLKEGKIEGVVFCSNTVGDADFETCRLLKEYIDKYK